jgi:hypothetical protein
MTDELVETRGSEYADIRDKYHHQLEKMSKIPSIRENGDMRSIVTRGLMMTDKGYTPDLTDARYTEIPPVYFEGMEKTSEAEKYAGLELYMNGWVN